MPHHNGDRVPRRDVRTRRIRFSYPDGSLRRHYVDGVADADRRPLVLTPVGVGQVAT